MIIVAKTEMNEKWWIATNEDNSIVHYGKTDPPQQTETGLPNHSLFNDETSWKTELLNVYGIDVDNNEEEEITE